MEKEEKILNFLKGNTGVIAIVILLFGLYIRLKYVNINSAIWWDEGEYLSIAKELAFGINYNIPSVRQPFLPLLIALLYKLGISSLSVIKFFVVTIPSAASIYLTYLLGKDLYSKRVGLISSFIMAVFWVPLFWSARISTDLFGLFFSLLAFWSFWKGYQKKEKSIKYLAISGIALALGFSTRVGNVLAIIILALFILLTARLEIIKSRHLRYLALFSIIAVAPYLLWNYIKFGNPFAFWGLYFGTVSYASTASVPFFWGFFKFFSLYLDTVFFIMFLLDLISFYKLFLGFDILLKEKNEKLLADFFVLLMILVPTVYFAFIQRQSSTEPRWAMIMAPAIFFITARGFIFLYKRIMDVKMDIPYKRTISISIILILMWIGALQQISQADELIISKKDTYIQLKYAGEWMKENSDKNDLIFTSAVPQTSYYAERNVSSLTKTEDEFNKIIATLKPKFLEITSLEGYPEWVYGWPEKNKNLVVPVIAYFSDPENTRLVLAVYQFVDYPPEQTNAIANVNASKK